MNHPKIIHRVWLGPNRPDPKHVAFHAAIRDMHPGWTVIDWTDDLVAGIPLVLQEQYDNAPTYVHRADIVMMEVVHRFGGAVVGWDMETTRCIEPLIGDSSGWCTPDADGIAGGAFFGATPKHPALSALLRGCRDRLAVTGWHPNDPNIDTGPFLWLAVLGREGNGLIDVLGTQRTAYPIHYTQRELARDAEHMSTLRGDPEVYAIHHFAGSWLGDKIRDIKVRR